VLTTNAKLKAAGAGSQLNVTFTQKSVAGYTVDSAQSGSYPLVSVVKQFTGNFSNNISGVIDLGTNSLDFVGGSSDALYGVAFDYCQDAELTAKFGACNFIDGVLNPTAYVKGATVGGTVTGNFSFLDNAGTGCDDTLATGAIHTNEYVQLKNGVAQDNHPQVQVGCGAVDFTGGSYSLGAKTYVGLQVDGTNDTEKYALPLAPGAFTATTTVTYEKSPGNSFSDTTETVASGAVGTWTTNGFTGFIPYMPYDAEGTLSRIVYITNATAKSGAVSITVGANGKACTSSNVTTAVGAGVTQLSGVIDEAVASCFPTLPANGKVWVSVSADFRAVNGSQMYSAYAQNGVRYIVINTSNVSSALPSN
jgi:hypothetical protein